MPNLDSTAIHFSLVIPAYNEALVIEQAIEEATSALGSLVSAYEILVVDDGSSDDTGVLVQKISRIDSRVRLIQHGSNQGYGAALRNGFLTATGELVGFTDADCQFDLSELDRFLLLSQKYDAVCGYRIDRQDAWLRCFYSRVYNGIVRLLFAIRLRDVDCALKVFRRDTLQKTTLQSDGFVVNSELLTQLRDAGGSIVEVGVTHRPRAAGQSTVSVRHIPAVLVSLIRYWWNHTQFPGNWHSSQPNVEPIMHRRLAWMQLAWIAVVCLFLFTNLSYPLIDRDETRYAEIPREMLVTGDWVLPTLNFETYYDKPPMIYWLVATSYTLFGIHEWSARLVPTLAALGTFLLVVWFGNRHFDRKVGLISGGVLVLTAGFAFCSRYLLIDGVLTFFTTAALMTSYEAVCDGTRKSPHKGWWLAASILCGIGLLTKGPLAIILLLPIVVAFTWLSHNTTRTGWLHVTALLAIAGGVAMPWMVAVSLQDRIFLWEFFVNHNVFRFAGQYHNRPFWYFVPVVMLAGCPWSFMTISLMRHLTARTKSVRSWRPPIVGFLCLWTGWMFVFFSASRCKLPTYVLPAAPALSLLLGTYISRLLSSNPIMDEWERFTQFWSARSAALTICIVGMAALVYADFGGHSDGCLIKGWSIIWVAVFCGLLVVFVKCRVGQSAWAVTAALSILLLTMFLHYLVPEYSRSQAVFAHSAAESYVVYHADAVPIATVAHEFSDVPFYLRRDDIKNFTSGELSKLAEFVRSHRLTLLVVDKRTEMSELQKQMPPGTSLQLVGCRGPARLIEASRRTEGGVARSRADEPLR